MPTELKELALEEISLVDRPANKSARVLLWKSETGPPKDDEKEEDDDNPADSGVISARTTGDKPTGKETKVPDDKTKKAGGDDLAKQVETLTKQVEELTTERDAAVAKAEKADADLKATTEAAKKSAGDEVYTTSDGDQIRKSEVGASVYDILVKQDQQLAAERNARELDGFTKDAETNLANLPGEPLKKGAALLAVSKLGDGPRETLEEMLKAGDAALGDLGKPAGGTGEPTSLAKAKDATVQFNAKVAEIAKRDNCSHMDASSRAVSEHPELFKSMQEAK